MEVFLGLVLILASMAAFYVAIPRGGQVVRFLRWDSVQAAYSTALLLCFFLGAVLLFAGLSGADPFGGYQ